MKTGIYWQDPKYALRPGQDFIFDPSLVLYLPLHKLDGASIMSRDAYGHLGTVTGALWTPRGRSFDGDDDDISTPDHASLDITGAITVEVWHKWTATANVQPIVVKGTAFGNPCNYQLLIYQDTRLFFEFWAGGVRKVLEATGDIVGDNVWKHTVGVYDGTNQIIYSQGVENNTANVGSLTLDTDNTDLRIGRNDAYSCKSLIGEVRIYNRGLTPLEVQRNYLASKGRYQ